MKVYVLLFSALFVITTGCNQNAKKDNTDSTGVEKFINPPMPGVQVPFTEYTVDASKADTLIYASGSMLILPPRAFVDATGKTVEGAVQLKYREFSSPIDFYLSGIPMDYDSMGTRYTFESSGMCEVLAFQNEIPVFVNPVSRPQLYMATENKSADHSLYFLDTLQEKWVNICGSVAIEAGMSAANKPNTETAYNDNAESPIMPQKANDASPVIKIVIDPASFKELLVYDNMQFQVDAAETRFNPKDADADWSNVELKKGKAKGMYMVKFSNPGRSVSYNVHPVLEGKDYTKALQVFEKNNTLYKKNMQARMQLEKGSKKQYMKDSLLNNKILAENAEIDKINLLVEARNRIITKQNEDAEIIFRELNEKSMAKNLFRSLDLMSFGIWNCDVPMLTERIPIAATFQDDDGNSLNLKNIAVIHKPLKSIFNFGGNNIQVMKAGENMIIGITNGRFAYITYDAYSNLGINADTKEQRFKMNIAAVEDNVYLNIQKIVGGG